EPAWSTRLDRIGPGRSSTVSSTSARILSRLMMIRSVFDRPYTRSSSASTTGSADPWSPDIDGLAVDACTSRATQTCWGLHGKNHLAGSDRAGGCHDREYRSSGGHAGEGTGGASLCGAVQLDRLLYWRPRGRGLVNEGMELCRWRVCGQQL